MGGNTISSGNSAPIPPQDATPAETLQQTQGSQNAPQQPSQGGNLTTRDVFEPNHQTRMLPGETSRHGRQTGDQAVVSLLQDADIRLRGMAVPGAQRGAQAVVHPTGGAETAPLVTADSIAREAQHSGLNRAQSAELQRRLDRLPAQERAGEIQFLQQHVLNTPNADRALLTYNDLNRIQAAHHNATRLTNADVHTLTRAVAEPRANTQEGMEGVMGRRQAVDAANTLVHMPEQHYNELRALLDRAGRPDAHAGVAPHTDPDMQRALILESLAARDEAFRSPHPSNQSRLAMQELSDFAASIRRMDRAALVRDSTVTSLGPESTGWEQQWDPTCAPTTAQIARAEADPIYAQHLHRHPDQAATEQANLLSSAGGAAYTPTPPQLTNWSGHPLWSGPIGPHDVGTQTGPENRMFNQFASGRTNRHYQPHLVNSAAEREAELNRCEALLRQGIDIPFDAETTTAGHTMLFTDVRGHGSSRQYLVADPAGYSYWVSHRDLVAGNTVFGDQGGRMTLAGTYR